ncbi:YbjQ family protein [Cereibacter sphaeroides]|uniref:YbjQ family protein n=1 Tax=Cereibacter sphaeroides TaxID=1063 RepID=UPI003FCE9230
MANCKTCGEKVSFFDLTGGECWECGQRRMQDEGRAIAEAERAERERAAAIQERASALLLTTEAAHNLTVQRRIGIVSAERIFGLSAFKDLLVSARDLVGGKSTTLERAFQDARREALDELRLRAIELGADAVVGVAFTHAEIGTSAMVMVAVTGTAVTLEPAPAASAP